MRDGAKKSSLSRLRVGLGEFALGMSTSTWVWSSEELRRAGRCRGRQRATKARGGGGGGMGGEMRGQGDGATVEAQGAVAAVRHVARKRMRCRGEDEQGSDNREEISV